MDSPIHNYLSTPCSSINDSIRTNNSVCESPVGVVPELSNDGFLNLSNRGIARLPSQYRNLYESVVKLNVSRNVLRYFDLTNFTDFINCVWVNASQNDIAQIKYVNCALYTNLQHLDLSDNKLLSIDQIQKFVALQCLDASHNRIERFSTTVELKNLTTLRIGFNHLRSLPSISSLINLKLLDLNGNRIRTIEDLPRKLPKTIQNLDIGGNMIDDLCEMRFLFPHLAQLYALTVAKNVCVREEGRDFDYRPYVHSCVLGNLKVVDGFCLSEEEILKGEWLHTEAKCRHFRPKTGAHDALCEYLTEECPIQTGLRENNRPPPTDQFSNKMIKVIEKRRQYQTRDDSVGRDEFTSPIIVKQPSATSSQKSTPFTSHNFTPASTASLGRGKKEATTATCGGFVTSSGGSARNNIFMLSPRQGVGVRKFAKRNVQNATPGSGTRNESGGDLSLAHNLTSSLNAHQFNQSETKEADQQRPHSADSSSTVVLSCSESISLSKSLHGCLAPSYKNEGDGDTTPAEDLIGDVAAPPLTSSSMITARHNDAADHATTRWTRLDDSAERQHFSRQTPVSSRNNQSVTMKDASEEKTDDDDSGAREEEEDDVFVDHASPPPFLTPQFSSQHQENGVKKNTVQEWTKSKDQERFDYDTHESIGETYRDGDALLNTHRPSLSQSSMDDLEKWLLDLLSTRYDSRLSDLQRRVDELAESNNLLTTINEQQTKTIVDFSSTVLELKEAAAKLDGFDELVRTMIPTPACLKYKRASADTLLITWENIIPLISFIDGYELSLNDVPAGRVLARNKQALISDIQHDEQYKISFKTISRFQNLRSHRVDLLIPKQADESALLAAENDANRRLSSEKEKETPKEATDDESSPHNQKENVEPEEKEMRNASPKDDGKHSPAHGKATGEDGNNKRLFSPVEAKQFAEK